MLAAELSRLLGSDEGSDLDAFVRRLRSIPRGLRAMGSIYQLDVSVTLDDLGWHFANWHNRPYCDETLNGLRVLEATEAASIFAEAYNTVQPYWEQIGDLVATEFQDFVSWYYESDLERVLEPMNERMWNLHAELEDHGLLTYWLTYARKYPDNVVAIAH